MSFKSKYVLLSFTLTLILAFSLVASSRSIAELENMVDTEMIPEVRQAAAMALGEKYKESDMTLSELEEIATTATRKETRQATVPALAQRYADVTAIGSSAAAQTQAKELQGRLMETESAPLKEAMGDALTSFFVAFNINGVEGYGVKDLEKTIEESECGTLKKAAAEALASIYPNSKGADELETMIKETESELIKEAAAKALALLYSSPMSPVLSVEDLQKMATDEDLGQWMRKAAGMAFGKLADQEMTIAELETLAKNPPTPQLGMGASAALARALKESDKTENELLNMIAPVSGVGSSYYREALVQALADRFAL